MNGTISPLVINTWTGPGDTRTRLTLVFARFVCGSWMRHSACQAST